MASSLWNLDLDPRGRGGLWQAWSHRRIEYVERMAGIESGWRQAVEHCAAADVWLDWQDAGVLLTRERAVRLVRWAGEMNRSLKEFAALVAAPVGLWWMRGGEDDRAPR